MSLIDLPHDEMIAVLSHLGMPDLRRFSQASKHCLAVASVDELWASDACTICKTYGLDADDFLDENESSPLLPECPNPLKLSMPNPIIPDNEVIKIGDEGLLYRCYPATQKDRAGKDRTDHEWMTCPFPMTCCDGAHFASRAEFEEHVLDIRHIERMQQKRGRGRLFDTCIDPRLVMGEEAFASMPKRTQYVRMSRYINTILPEINRRCDPSTWSEDDWVNLRTLSQAGHDFADEIVAENEGIQNDYFGQLVLQSDEDLDPMEIGMHICNSVVNTFFQSGVYSEAVPYFTVRDFLTRGLAACDPDGGSASGEQWWRGVSELFDWHYDGGDSDSDGGW